MIPQFTKQDVSKPLQEFLAQSDRKIHAELSYLGSEYVTKAKKGGSYKNITGNLRSSIGYIVGNNGVAVENVCEGESEEGRKAGTEFGLELLAEHNRGWVLIIYAGMNYAIYVENHRSVLTTFLPGEQDFAKVLLDLIADE